MWKAMQVIVLGLILAVPMAAHSVIIEAEDSGLVTRSSGWNVASGSTISGGFELETGVVGATLTLSFFGTGIEVFGITGPNAGIFNLAIDGGSLFSFDTFSSGFLVQQSLGSVTGLSNGSHTAVLTTAQTQTNRPFLFVDFFEVDAISAVPVPVPEPVPEPTTTALLALGLLGAGFSRRRRTH